MSGRHFTTAPATASPGVMKTVAITLALACAVAAPGCAGVPSSGSAPAPVLIPLDEARALIPSGQVREIFQPHQGCVILTLRDGRVLAFDQPHLDWVLHYVRDHGLEDRIEALTTE